MWIYPGYEHDRNVSAYLADGENEFPGVFVSFPSARDPLWEQGHPGTATLEAITMAPYEWFEQWKERPWKKRGEDYERFKQRLSARLLASVEEHVPAIRGKIDYHELSTPLSTRDLVNYPLGEMYGIEHSPSRFQQKWLQPRTPIRNLFLTGQDITTVGVTGALLAGLLTASVVLKRNLLREL
jgi:all-trans-retinol 13,14-reductase